MKLFDKFLANQSKQPYGFFGKLIGKLMIKGNNSLNQFMKGNMDIQPDDHILEIGFGSGQLILEMAQIAEQGFVAGIDFSEAMVQQAQKRNKPLITLKRVEIKQASLEKISYKNNCFDKVATANTIYFWPNPTQNIKEIFRVVKPGGRFVLGFRNKEQLESIPFTKLGFTLYTIEDVKTLMQQGGFSDVKILSKQEKRFDSHCAIGEKNTAIT